VIVDAHHHLWDLSAGYRWLDDPSLKPIRRSFGPADLRAELLAAGVSHTVLVEAGRCEPSEVDEFLAIATETPEIAGVVGWCDLADPRLPGSPLLVGARAQVQGEPDPGYLARQDVRDGLRRIADAGLAYDLVIRSDQLVSAADAAEAIPHLTFVLDHLGKPSIRDGVRALPAWRESLAALAAHPNVYAKLSGLVTEADWRTWRPADLQPFVDTAVELFGPRRLMFGSDWPVCLLAASYSDVLAALRDCVDSLGPIDKANIFGQTAIRAYKLTVGVSAA
jgi:L-fuconolactonase